MVKKTKKQKKQTEEVKKPVVVDTKEVSSKPVAVVEEVKQVE